MKTAKLQDYLLFEGKPAQVIAINPGEKAVIMEFLEEEKCPHCQGLLGKKQIEVIESSPMFQEGAKAIQTITQ